MSVDENKEEMEQSLSNSIVGDDQMMIEDDNNEKSGANSTNATALNCSRCLSFKNRRDITAWTLSTLRQTAHESEQSLRPARGENNEAMNKSELLRQYRLLQVSH